MGLDYDKFPIGKGFFWYEEEGPGGIRAGRMVFPFEEDEFGGYPLYKCPVFSAADDKALHFLLVDAASAVFAVLMVGQNMSNDSDFFCVVLGYVTPVDVSSWAAHMQKEYPKIMGSDKSLGDKLSETLHKFKITKKLMSAKTKGTRPEWFTPVSIDSTDFVPALITDCDDSEFNVVMWVLNLEYLNQKISKAQFLGAYKKYLTEFDGHRKARHAAALKRRDALPPSKPSGAIFDYGGGRYSVVG
jgi:hypothetical protein